MKGLVKFILAVLVFFLLALVAGGILSIIWVERHLYVGQGIPINVPELDIPHQAKLIKLLPLNSFLKSDRTNSSIKVGLTEKETNWLLNYYLSKKRPGSKAELRLMQDRISGKYTRELNPRKHQNLVFDADINYQNCLIQIDLERVQIGDYLVPTTVLGQLSSLIEYYLETHYCSANGQGIKIQDLKVKPDYLQLLLVKP